MSEMPFFFCRISFAVLDASCFAEAMNTVPPQIADECFLFRLD